MALQSAITRSISGLVQLIVDIAHPQIDDFNALRAPPRRSRPELLPPHDIFETFALPHEF